MKQSERYLATRLWGRQGSRSAPGEMLADSPSVSGCETSVWGLQRGFGVMLAGGFLPHGGACGWGF